MRAAEQEKQNTRKKKEGVCRPHDEFSSGQQDCRPADGEKRPDELSRHRRGGAQNRCHQKYGLPRKCIGAGHQKAAVERILHLGEQCGEDK